MNKKTPKELWRVIPETDGIYAASTCGRIKTLKTRKLVAGTILKQSNASVKKNPRRVVQFCVQGQTRQRLVAHLVLLAFRGPRRVGTEACHKDDNGDNNSLANLRWGTRESNYEDRLRNGRQPRGERVVGAKLTDKFVRVIRKLRLEGVSAPKIAARYGVTKRIIYLIERGELWAHVK